MKRPFAVLVIFALFASASSAASILPTEAQVSLKRWNSKFEAFKPEDYSPTVQKLISQPSVATGDLNGDSINDYAVIGAKDEKNQAIVALLSNKKDPKKWTAVVVEEFEFENVKSSSVPSGKGMEKGVPLYLTIAKDFGLAGDYKRINKKDVLQVQAHLGAVELFVIEHSKALRLRPKGK